MQDKMNIFREVASIASAHASSAFSEMLKKKIKLTLPKVTFISSQEVFKDMAGEKQVVCVETKLLSGIRGKVSLVLEEKRAYELINRLYKEKKEKVSSGASTETGLSLIKEIGNIVVSSYVGALGVFLNILILPSMLILVNGTFSEVMRSMFTSQEEFVLLIEVLFKEEESEIKGKIYFVLTEEGRKVIEESCEKILKSLEEGENENKDKKLTS